MGWWKKIKSVKRSILPKSYVNLKSVSPVKKRDLEQQRSRLLEELRASSDADSHWACHDTCDGMLWEGKRRAIDLLFNSTALEKAESNGRFYRKPSKDCMDLNRSASTWSRDMAVGLLWWCWRSRNGEALRRHIHYGRKHKHPSLGWWVMGDGPPARTLYNPWFKDLVYKVFDRITGSNHKNLWSYVFFNGLDDYEAHLQCMIIALIAEIDGKIPKEAYKRVKEHCDRAPGNPLYNVLLARLSGGDPSGAVYSCFNPRFDTYVRANDNMIENVRKCELLFAIDFLLRGM